MEYLKTTEKLSDFPEKYNKHVVVTRLLSRIVLVLLILVIWLILRAEIGHTFQSFWEIVIGVVVMVIGHIVIKKIIDPLFVPRE